MTEVYYCKDENDIKRVAMHIFQSDVINRSFEESRHYANICVCDFAPIDTSCNKCELEKCLLIKHMEDKDVYKHISLFDDRITYPCIVCMADTHYNDEKVTICSIAQAKENTKYGVS